VRWAGHDPGAASVAALSFALGVPALVIPIVVYLALPHTLAAGLLVGAFGPLLLIAMCMCALAALALGVLARRAGASARAWLPGVVVSSTALLATTAALAVLMYVFYS